MLSQQIYLLLLFFLEVGCKRKTRNVHSGGQRVKNYLRNTNGDSHDKLRNE